MLKFARQHHSRSSSVDRTGLTSSPRGSPRSASVERNPPSSGNILSSQGNSLIPSGNVRGIPKRTSTSPPPPVPLRQTLTSVSTVCNEEKSNSNNKTKTSSDYEAISTLCLLPGNFILRIFWLKS